MTEDKRSRGLERRLPRGPSCSGSTADYQMKKFQKTKKGPVAGAPERVAMSDEEDTRDDVSSVAMPGLFVLRPLTPRDRLLAVVARVLLGPPCLLRLGAARRCASQRGEAVARPKKSPSLQVVAVRAVLD